MFLQGKKAAKEADRALAALAGQSSPKGAPPAEPLLGLLEEGPFVVASGVTPRQGAPLTWNSFRDEWGKNDLRQNSISAWAHILSIGSRYAHRSEKQIAGISGAHGPGTFMQRLESCCAPLGTLPKF